ncbi:MULTISPECIES: hypothetical protein [unclassified Bacteroides]|jgi:hypothetical protein|uniref:hypothetical protein n=1 Tax=unclassified Bacteroides TaxID=2646097 RepID=UPI004063831E
MKKNVFKGLLTMCAFAAAFTSCSKENNEIPNPGENDTKSVFMKLDLNQKPQTKAVEAPINTGTKAQVSELHVYFYKDSDKSIQKYLKINGTSTPSLTQLTGSGAQIPDVPVAADRVLVRGNVPSSVTLPTSGLITAVENLEINITTQNDKDNILLGHLAVTIQTYPGGGVAPIAGMQDGDKYAEVTLEPAVARIEIEGLQAQGAVVNGFSLDGIYLTNFYEKLKMGDGSSVSPIVQYGADATKYDENAASTLYTTANKGKLFDKFASALAASGSPLEVTPTPATNRWAYHVFQNEGTTANDQLQLVFKLSNVTAAPGSGVTLANTQFLTVRGFKNNLGQIVKIEKGKIYTISKADFKFDEGNLSTVPNTTAVGVWLKVTVQPWTVVAVKPNL